MECTTALKILVADDEMPIRTELQGMAWEQNGYSLVGVARHGVEALSLCKEQHPDIVITDITMPIMDGLELIERLRVELPRTKFIILACHQDFTYAKQAIQLNVVDYLLKTDLCNDTVMASVGKAAAELLEDNRNQQNVEQHKRRKLAGLLTTCGPDTVALVAELSAVNFQISPQSECLFVFVENRLKSWVFVELAIHEFFVQNRYIANWLMVDNGCYALKLHEHTESAAMTLLQSLIAMVGQNFPFALQKFFFYSVAVKMPDGITSFIEILKNLSALQALHFYAPGQLFFSYTSSKLRQLRPTDSNNLCEVLRAAQNSPSTADTLSKWAVNSYLCPTDCKRLFVGCMRQLRADELEGSEEFLARVEVAFDIVELQALFDEYLQIRSMQYSRYEIRKVIQIIEEEYSNSLTLPQLAERVSLSPQYLSRIFGEQVGEGIADYILHIRLEKAQQLILQSDMKVYQVAEAVGIPNYRYFSGIFKKATGLTPKEMKGKGAQK